MFRFSYGCVVFSWGWFHNGMLKITILNRLRLRQNGHHFPDGIFIWIFLNQNVWISIKILLKFVPKGPIDNNPALIQIMAWHQPGDKPLSEPVLVSLLMHICVTQPQWVKICSKIALLNLQLQLPGHNKLNLNLFGIFPFSFYHSYFNDNVWRLLQINRNIFNPCNLEAICRYLLSYYCLLSQFSSPNPFCNQLALSFSWRGTHSQITLINTPIFHSYTVIIPTRTSYIIVLDYRFCVPWNSCSSSLMISKWFVKYFDHLVFAGQ